MEPRSPDSSLTLPGDAPAPGYTVLARRYRPQQFADLIGQEHVARSLVNALAGNRVAHAYVFTGARGVGKTSTARILAKALNCVRGPTTTPCDACSSCLAIASGEDVDVIEIDGASNRRIEEAREIRGNVQYRPSRSRFKIYIIDEVHQLTKDAFNALLKTLEEPPPHVKFIFATTEIDKVPLTILSRCQRFDFAGIPGRQIVDRLRAVVAAEGLRADDDALELVARRAGGSMRDAQSLLDQLLAFGGERLTAEQVHQLLGTAHDDRVAELAAAVLAHDARLALDLLADDCASGLQFSVLLHQLITWWRDLMVVQCAGDQARDLSVPPRLRPLLAQQAEGVSLDTVLAGLDILAATKVRLYRSNHGRALVEMALVRLGRLDDLVSLAQLGQWLAKVPTAAAGPASPPTAPTRPAGVVPRLSQALEDEKKKAVAPEPAIAPTPGPAPLTVETVAEVWRKALGQMTPVLAQHLEKARIPAISGPNTLVIGFDLEYSGERDYCQEPRRLAAIEEKLRQAAGAPWSLRVETIAAAPVARPAGNGVDVPETSPASHRRQRDEALKQVPLVRRMLEALDASIVRVDDGFGAARPEPSPTTEPPIQET